MTCVAVDLTDTTMSVYTVTFTVLCPTAMVFSDIRNNRLSLGGRSFLFIKSSALNQISNWVGIFNQRMVTLNRLYCAHFDSTFSSLKDSFSTLYFADFIQMAHPHP